MLFSLCLLLRAHKEEYLPPPTLGRAAHAAFLGLVQKLDSGLAGRLHSGRVKPFTVFFSQGGQEMGTRHNHGLWLRITSLDEQLSQLLLELASKPDGLSPLKLLNAEFEVAKVYHRQEEHPWAGHSSFEELYNNGIAIAQQGKNTIGLQFVSPTAFRMVNSRLNMPLPLPHLVFRSLAEKWNAFSLLPLRINWQKFDRAVTIARHRLETQLLDFGRYAQVGFVGECLYLIDNRAAFQLLRALQILAEFAFYAGAGRKTTMGMGQVRRIR